MFIRFRTLFAAIIMAITLPVAAEQFTADVSVAPLVATAFPHINSYNMGTVETENATPANCPQKVFAAALVANADAVNESDAGYIIQNWIYSVFQSPVVIKDVLACPEIAALGDEDDFTVPPIEYNFPAGRKIILNYSTQPKILKQRMQAEAKRALFDGLASAEINAENVWVSTDPAWYGILVVQAGALDKYVGPDKDNTLSLDYLYKHVGEFYPKNANEGHTPATIPMCTTRSALADDNDIVNLAAHITAGEEDKAFSGNDYYVADDVSLRWISYAQIAADIVITIVSFGGGAVVMGATRSIRATKVFRNAQQVMGKLRKIDKVRDFEKTGRTLRKAEVALANTNKAIDAEREAIQLATKIQDLSGEAANSARLAQKYGKTTEEINALKKLDIPARQKNLETTLANAAKTHTDDIKKLKESMAEMEKIEDVKKYKNASQAFDNMVKLRRDLKAWRIPQRGNIVARSVKTARAFVNANKSIGKSSKAVRAAMSTKSAKAKDWMFHNAWRLANSGAKVERDIGFVYGAIKASELALDFYDWTETSIGEYTNNIEFKPIGLLSADDLEGADNIVNHGMWLMWAGDSLSPADDDAAYLQAMDFAAKFHEDMEFVQDQRRGSRLPGQLCDVDIYVVRPVIRNPGTEDALYYLIMNDVPWAVRASE